MQPKSDNQKKNAGENVDETQKAVIKKEKDNIKKLDLEQLDTNKKYQTGVTENKTIERNNKKAPVFSFPQKQRPKSLIKAVK